MKPIITRPSLLIKQLLSFTLIIVTIGTLTHSQESTRTYSVKKTPGKLLLSGKADDPQWKSASALSDFQYPWENERPYPTTFKALHDDEWLYCFFDVKDPAAHIHVDKDHKSEVAASSRAEIFFRANDKMNPYYCLEMDGRGRVFDYQAFYHRKFNTDWSWPEGHLMIKTDRRKDGYSIEVALSKSSLNELGLLKNNILQAGLFRGDCFPKAGAEPDFKWISWVKPDSDTPDFHIPSAFGLLRLEE